MPHIHESYYVSKSHMNHSRHIRGVMSSISHMNEARPIWMSHVPYEWVMLRVYIPYERVMSHKEQLCHLSPIWMRHAPYEWVMPHMNESYCSSISHMNESCHIRRSHVVMTFAKEPCFCRALLQKSPIFKGSFAEELPECHIRRSHVIMIEDACISHVPYEWVMSHMNKSCPIWISHVPYEWVMSHMNESCYASISHMNDSCHKRRSHVIVIEDACIATYDCMVPQFLGLFCKRALQK